MQQEDSLKQIIRLRITKNNIKGVKMADLRIEIRLSEQEKKELVLVAQKNDMTVSEYMKYRLFINNSELLDHKYTYETPSKDRHQYINMGITNDIYWMVYNMISEQKGEEKMKEFQTNYRISAKESMVKYGYTRIEKDE